MDLPQDPTMSAGVQKTSKQVPVGKNTTEMNKNIFTAQRQKLVSRVKRNLSLPCMEGYQSTPPTEATPPQKTSA